MSNLQWREPGIERAGSLAPRTAALIAGFGYIALFALAIFGNFVVVERLVETGDASATFQNIADAESLVRMSIVAFVVVFVLDVVVAWALYFVFRPDAPSASLLSAWFRIVYTVFLGIAVVFLFAVLQLVGSEDHVVALGDNAREAQAMFALDAFTVTWLIGLTCFGLHLVSLGVISIRTGVAPRALGVLLVVAGAAYVFDTTAYALLRTYSDHEAVFTAVVAIPAVVAEAALTIWLLRRGGKPRNWLAPERGASSLPAVPAAGYRAAR